MRKIIQYYYVPTLRVLRTETRLTVDRAPYILGQHFDSSQMFCNITCLYIYIYILKLQRYDKNDAQK